MNFINKIRNKKHVLMITLAVLFSVACAVLLTTSDVKADANDFTLSAQIDENSCFLGNMIQVPKGTFGGKKAQLNVTTPDGTIYNNPKKLTFSQAGAYELVYTGKSNGSYLVERRNIEIKNEQFSTSDGKKNFSYGANTQTQRDGLNITLSKGTSFNINNIVNLWETSEESPAITYTVPVNHEGAFDAAEIMFRFTDAYDPSNYFEMKISTIDEVWNRVFAAAAGRVFGGYNNSSTGAFSTSYGTVYNMYSNNSYAETTWSAKDIFKNQKVSIWYDVTENAVYISFYHFEINEDMVAKICDFDNVEEQSSPWSGFSTGEVFISIEENKYKNKSAQLQILDVHGIDLKETNFDDTGKTVITVDTDGQKLPTGKVGYHYPVLQATVVNPYANKQMDYAVRVFYQYARKDGMYNGTSNKYSYECDIKDGYFKTDHAGTYAICYRATDHYGETSERVVNVTVDDKVSPMSKLTLKDKVTSGEVGNIIYLANYDMPEGGIEPYSVVVTVKKDGVSQKIYGNEIDGRYFIPQSKGTYKVTIKAYDYIRNSTSQSYEIKIKKPTAPSFISEPDLPRYLIADTDYVLPEVVMKDYRDNSKVKAQITIIDGNGKTSYKLGKKYSFSPNSEGNAVIKYYSGSNERVYTLPVIDVINDNDDLDLTKFFVNRGVEIKSNATGLLFTANKDGSSDFIRDVSVRGLTTEMTLGGFGKNFKNFTITMVDSKDSTICVELQYVSDGTYCYKYANGRLLSKEPLADVTEAGITYDYKNNEISMGGVYGTLKEKDGSSFDGFTSGKVYMSFQIGDVTGNAEVTLKALKNQKMNEDTFSDRIKPTIYTDHDYGVVIREAGEVIKLYDVFADDVLSGYVHITLTATKDGKVITSDKGVKLSKVTPQKDSFTITDKGVYSLVYTAEDWYGNEVSEMVRFYVEEKNAPKVEVAKWGKTFEVGAIDLPAVSAKDDVTVEPVVYLTVFGPGGEIYKTNGKKFTATEKGQHILRITAFDEIGNTTIVEKEFTVK